MIKELLVEIFTIAYEVSETTDADVFVRYLPHCKAIDMGIHENGWTAEKGATYSKLQSYDVNGYKDEVEIKLDLQNIIRILKHLKVGGKLDTVYCE